MKNGWRIDAARSYLTVLLGLERFTALAWSDLKRLTGFGGATLKRSIDFLKGFSFDSGPVIWQDSEKERWAITTKGMKYLKWIRGSRRREASKWRRALQSLSTEIGRLDTVSATDVKREEAIYVPFVNGEPRGESVVDMRGMAIIRNAGTLSIEEAEDRVSRMLLGSHPWVGASIGYHYNQSRKPWTA